MSRVLFLCLAIYILFAPCSYVICGDVPSLNVNYCYLSSSSLPLLPLTELYLRCFYFVSNTELPYMALIFDKCDDK